MKEINEETVMSLILNAGNARTYAIEALRSARNGNFKEAENLIENSEDAMNEAHIIQTEMIQNELKGVKAELNLLEVHAQDHVMNAMTVYDLAKEIILMLKERNNNA